MEYGVWRLYSTLPETVQSLFKLSRTAREIVLEKKLWLLLPLDDALLVSLRSCVFLLIILLTETEMVFS